MQTPGTPPRTPPRTPLGTPTGRSHGTSQMSPGSPGAPISCRGLLFLGKGGVEGGVGKKPLPPPPNPPKAPKKVLKCGPIPGLPLLLKSPIKQRLMGDGAYGDVWEVILPRSSNFPLSPQPSFAMKQTNKPVSPSELQKEAKNYGTPGCTPGIAFTNSTGNYSAIMPIGTPLSNLDFFQLTQESVSSVISQTKNAIMNAPKTVVYDANLDNMMMLHSGTATVVLGADGQPSVGPRTTETTVLFCDVGNLPSPEDANKVYNAMLSEEDMVSDKVQAEYRRFKCDMMERLIMNQTLQDPLEDCDIVAPLCVEYGYTHAAGVRSQEMMSFE